MPKPSDKIATLGKQQVDLLEKDPDWVFSKRFGFSMAKLLEKYPDAVPEKIICSTLHLTPEELEAEYLNIVAQLQTLMKVDNE